MLTPQPPNDISGHPPTAHLTLRWGCLYKYKSLHASQFDYVTEIIRDCLIYIPKPSELNDPEECKPQQTVGDISDPFYLQKIESYLRRCVAHRVPPPSEAEIQAELRQLSPAHFETLIKEVTATYHQAVEERYRMLSLADSRENHHLWVNYADSYAGICLGFSVDPLFGNAYQVQYSESIPTFDVTNEEFDVLVATALTKRLKWKDEGEYRLVFDDPPIKGDPPLVNQKLRFPRNILTSIVFGYRVNRESRNRLIELIKDVAPNMAIFEATGGAPFQRVTITPLRI